MALAAPEARSRLKGEGLASFEKDQWHPAASAQDHNWSSCCAGKFS
tara:strand:- start:1131 stop:1268 length:138 start_codon:yes stop_codon:yes gene_type:complete